MTLDNDHISISTAGINQSFQVGDEKIDVLKNISFKLKKQSFNLIYGPSGSGKSTLLNILAGLQKPTSGTVMIGDRSLYGLSSDELAFFRSKMIGIVYQQNVWVRSLNVVENVAMPLMLSGVSRLKARRIAMEKLGEVGMQSYANKKIMNLSIGEQQRIAMARAIINDPMFIIADEPTGNLDSANGNMIMGLLQRFIKEKGKVIILVTHNLEYIPLADHLLTIKDGSMVETTDNKDIKTIADQLIDDTKKHIDELIRQKV